jgi:hypothetical protein
MKKKIIIAYHAFMAGEYYQTMMKEQFDKLRLSGLFDACDHLYIGITEHPGRVPENGVEWARDYWKDFSDKVWIVVHPGNNEEKDTIRWIRDYVFGFPDDYIFYLHTKSVTKCTPATEDWRRYMEYFNIEIWRDCITKLDLGYDCCGIMWNQDTPIGYFPHFSGNFWWAKASYLKTCNHGYLESDWRYHREFWVGSGANVKAFEFHNSGLNTRKNLTEGKGHFDVTYPRINYERNDNMKLHVIVTVFQRSQQLSRLIWDFLGQSNPNWLMHIVNDGPAPTEMTDFLAHHFNDDRIDFRSTPQVNGAWGFPNRKMMIQEIQCDPNDFILVTNDDNEYLQPFVEFFLNSCQSDVGFVYCNTIHSYMGYEILHTEVRSCYIDMGSFIVRADVAKKVGFNHQHEQADGAYAEECAAECRARGLRIVQVNKSLFCHN